MVHFKRIWQYNRYIWHINWKQCSRHLWNGAKQNWNSSGRALKNVGLHKGQNTFKVSYNVHVHCKYETAVLKYI